MSCDRCYGEGTIVVCPDDLCRNSDHCMHGDGERVCPVCNGDGDLSEDEDCDPDDYDDAPEGPAEPASPPRREEP